MSALLVDFICWLIRPKEVLYRMVACNRYMFIYLGFDGVYARDTRTGVTRRISNP
jgi:hypothetical protein